MDRARERRILVWMCVLIAVNQLGFGAVVPVLPLYAQSFGVPASAIGATIAVYGLARFFVGAPTGWLADRFGRRPTLALGGAVSCAGNLWCAAASTFPELVAARFVAGFGAGLVLTAGQVVLADISVPERRGRTMAIYQGTFLFAVGIGPFPGGLLAERLGLAAPFVAYGAAAAIVGAIAWLRVEETRGERSAAAGTAAPLPYAAQLRRIAAHAGFRLVSAVGFMNAVARTGAMFAIVPLVGSVRLGLSATQIGAGLALGSVLGILATYPVGVLVDRRGRKAVIVPACVGAGASLALFALAPSYPWFVAACLVWGVASASAGAAPAAYAADTAPAGMNAAAMSTFRMLSDLGYVVGPIGLGLIADLLDGEAALGAAALGLVAVALLFARYAPETHRAAPAPL